MAENVDSILPMQSSFVKFAEQNSKEISKSRTLIAQELANIIEADQINIPELFRGKFD
jgi:hypothetical protein